MKYSSIPATGSAEIKFGVQCIVRDYQCAVFFCSAKGGDIIPAGRHMLSTLNIPIVTNLLSLPWGFKSPFRCEVYFVTLKTFTDMRWGTTDPVAFRDKEFGLVRLRAHGTYTFKVAEPVVFINRLVAGDDSYTTEEIQEQLRSIIVSGFNDFLGENLTTVLDLPGQYTEMSEALQIYVGQEFKKFGLELQQFYVQSVTPPDEVQKAIDARASMGAVGNVDTFLKYKAAHALEGVAEGGGGAAGQGMGLAAGLGVGAILPGMIFGQTPGAPGGPPAAGSTPMVACAGCHSPMPVDSRFCGKCGKPAIVSIRCFKCNTDLPADSAFCLKCGTPTSQKAKCTKCEEELPGGAHFCLKCGEKVE
ncbi:MAG: SPFH domain-containing protein [Planctomycetota bacterium]